MRLRQSRRDTRFGAAAVEFAVVLPFLMFTVVVAVDFARVYRHAQVVMSAARNGALYGCDSSARAAVHARRSRSPAH